MVYRSTREVVSSRDPLPSQSETHVLSVLNMCPNLRYRRMHSNDRRKRAVKGTWVIHNVQVALQKDYTILEAHEVYEYNVTRYDPETREGRQFEAYIALF